MPKHGKKYREATEKIEKDRLYTPEEAAALIKEVSYTKFDASVDVHIVLGVDPRNAEQQVRGTLVLPHGTGKTKRVAVFANDERAEEAREAGADIVGGEDLVNQIRDGFTDFEACVATPDMMRFVGRIGRVLGPRGLMPSPKAGTVTNDLAQAINDIKGGRVEYKLDRFAVVHMCVGRASFSPEQLSDNINTVLETLMKARPASAKGRYMKSVTVAATMSPGLPVAYGS